MVVGLARHPEQEQLEWGLELDDATMELVRCPAGTIAARSQRMLGYHCISDCVGMTLGCSPDLRRGRRGIALARAVKRGDL